VHWHTYTTFINVYLAKKKKKKKKKKNFYKCFPQNLTYTAIRHTYTIVSHYIIFILFSMKPHCPKLPESRVFSHFLSPLHFIFLFVFSLKLPVSFLILIHPKKNSSSVPSNLLRANHLKIKLAKVERIYNLVTFFFLDLFVYYVFF
jgi:hypothetical protein